LDEVGEHASLTVLDLRDGVVLSRHGRDVYTGSKCVAFSGSNITYEATALSDDPYSGITVVRRLNVVTGESSRILGFSGRISGIFEVHWPSFVLNHAKDKFAFSRDDSRTVYMETLLQHPSHGTFSGEPGESLSAGIVRMVAVAPRGDLVVVLREKYVVMLDTRGSVRKVLPVGIKDTSGLSHRLTVSPDGQCVALAQHDETFVWSMDIDSCLRYDRMRCEFIQCFSSDSRLMACENGSFIDVWRLESEKMLLRILKPHSWGLSRLQFSTEGDFLLTDQGHLHIASATWTPDSTPMSAMGVNLTGSQELEHLLEKIAEWIRLDDEDLVWIPNEHRCRPRIADARGGTVALGQSDGSVMIMELHDPTGKYEIDKQ
jgi:hypothetical protein